MSKRTLSEVALATSFNALEAYERRNLLHHLVGAGLDNELHAVLAADDGSGANAWYELRRAHDEVNGYVGDLMLAKQRALIHPDWSIPLALRYALIGASISSQAAVIAPNLLDAMVKSQVISLGHATTIARENPRPGHRAIGLALLSLHPGASKDLEAEALGALALTLPGDGSTPRIGFDQSEAHARLLQILPLGVSLPRWRERNAFGEPRRPPLRQAFAHLFHQLEPGRYREVASIFQRSDRRAATELLALIGLSTKRTRRWFGAEFLSRIKAYLSRLVNKVFRSRAAWELERLKEVTERDVGPEEIAAALIGLIRAGVQVLPDPEALALQTIGRIRHRDDRLLFLAWLVEAAHDPAPAVAVARKLLEADVVPTYAAAVVVASIWPQLTPDARKEMGARPLSLALMYKQAGADRFRLAQFGEQVQHRTTLVARALADSGFDLEAILPACVEGCGASEHADYSASENFREWLTAKVVALAKQTMGENASDPGAWHGKEKVDPLERGRNLAAVIAYLPIAPRQEILRGEYKRLVTGLHDGEQLATYEARIAAYLPRDVALQVLRQAITTSHERKIFTKAVATTAADTEGLELLGTFDPEVITPDLLQRLSLEDLLAFKKKVDAEDVSMDRAKLLTEIAIAAFVSHGKDLFQEAIDRLARESLHFWNVDEVVRLASAAPAGYGRRLAALAEGLSSPPAWRGDNSAASARATLCTAIALRKDMTHSEMVGHALRESVHSYDHVRVEILGKLAPVLSLDLSNEIDRVLSAMEKRDARLEAISSLVAGASEAVAEHYAQQALKAVRRSDNQNGSDSWNRALLIHRLAPRMNVDQVLDLMPAHDGRLNIRVPLLARLAELGHWKEAWSRAEAAVLVDAREILAVLPHVPEDERRPIVGEIATAIENSRPEYEFASIFPLCMSLRPYMDPTAWEDLVIRRIRDCLTQGIGAKQIEQLLQMEQEGKGVLSTLRLARLWNLVTELGLDDRSRVDVLRDAAIVLPAIAAQGSPDDLLQIHQAVHDVVRWWPPEPNTNS